MTYLELKQFKKPYVVVRTTGCGEQGGEPIKRHEYLGDFNTYEDALEYGREKFPRDPSGWTYYNFSVDVNTSSKIGKVLLKKFRAEFKEREKYIKVHPDDFITYDFGSGSITIEYNEALDGPKENWKK